MEEINAQLLSEGGSAPDLIVLLWLDPTSLRSHQRPGLSRLFYRFHTSSINSASYKLYWINWPPKEEWCRIQVTTLQNCPSYLSNKLTLWISIISWVVEHEVVCQKRGSKFPGRKLLRKVTLHNYQGHLKLFQLPTELWASKGIAPYN